MKSDRLTHNMERMIDLKENWKSVLNFMMFIALCLALISCGGAPVVPISQSIDISNDEVLDEYVDITESTMPSLFKNLWITFNSTWSPLTEHVPIWSIVNPEEEVLKR